MQPLKGLTVVTLEHAIAAPFATRQLADLGACVIKIERPGVGDFARGYDSRVRGLASHFVWTNRSKESLTLDVKQPEAAKVLERLVLERSHGGWRQGAGRLERVLHGGDLGLASVPVVGAHDTDQQHEHDGGGHQHPVGRAPEGGEERGALALVDQLLLLEQGGLVPG